MQARPQTAVLCLSTRYPSTPSTPAGVSRYCSITGFATKQKEERKQDMTLLQLWLLAQAYADAALTAPDWVAPYLAAVRDALLALLRSYGWPV